MSEGRNPIVKPLNLRDQMDAKNGIVRRIFIAGIPRSGTTWVARGISSAANCVYIHEPDNEKSRTSALRAKGTLGRFPILNPGDVEPGYEALWQQAFDGQSRKLGRLRKRMAGLPLTRLSDSDFERYWATKGRMPSIRILTAYSLGSGGRFKVPNDRHIVTKSVHAPLALEWIYQKFHPETVVVIRHPLNILASLLELDLPDADRELDKHPRVVERLLIPHNIPPPREGALKLERVAWQVGLMTFALLEAARKHPEWILARHEVLCEDPLSQFRSLCSSLQLEWDPAVSHFLGKSNRTGSGFDTNRISREQPHRWKSRLREDQQRAAIAILRNFPIAGLYEELGSGL
jgi:hypothetical protein